jgi:xanthine dehydrogenase YagS FAD-binding subunit
LQLRRPESVAAAVSALDDGEATHALAGGTEVVPLLRDGLLRAETLVHVRDAVPAGIRPGVGTVTVGAGATLAALEAAPEVPDALREACRLAASPQLRTMSTIGGNLLQATRCWYWRLRYPCRLHGGDRCFAREGEHREHAIFANGFCASAHPSDPAAALLALDAVVVTDRRRLPVAALYRLPDESSREVTTLERGELIVELEVPQPEASVYLKAMDRRAWSFALVGVAAARRGGEMRLALAGVAPIPWALAGPEQLDEATPLPRNAYKLDLARTLVRRALDGIGAPHDYDPAP